VVIIHPPSRERPDGAQDPSFLALLGVALLAGGCGKDKPDPTTAWASDFCSSITTWEDSVSATANSIAAGNLSKRD
jgi:hypothetical protein